MAPSGTLESNNIQIITNTNLHAKLLMAHLSVWENIIFKYWPSLKYPVPRSGENLHLKSILIKQG